jgi:hypothetical protein
MTNPTTLTTNELWTRTHRALCQGDWSYARADLEDLSRRADVRDRLSSAADYGVPDCMLGVIGDRIDAVNLAVERGLW